MRQWTIEVHQLDGNRWVGVVKQRPGVQKARYVSDGYEASAPAYLECVHWIKLCEEQGLVDVVDATAVAPAAVAADPMATRAQARLWL